MCRYFASDKAKTLRFMRFFRLVLIILYGHSFATTSLENGDDIKTVQTNLGHFAPAFTLKTYAHVSNQMQQSSAARMEELIAGLPVAK